MSSTDIINKNQLLLFIGSDDFFRNLFEKINAKSQLNSIKNKVIINSLNKKINISTKYYKTEFDFKIIKSNEKIEIQDDILLLGFVICLDDTQIDSSLFSREDILKVALFNLNSSKNKDIYCEKYNFDCIEIRDLSSKNDENENDDDDDEFDYVDDLLNSLFSYKWPIINSGDSKIDSNEQEFENILWNLKSMREEASKLSSDERKDYAEKVVQNFLNIIGANDESDSDN